MDVLPNRSTCRSPNGLASPWSRRLRLQDTQADRDRLAREKGGHRGGASPAGSGATEDAPGADEEGRCSSSRTSCSSLTAIPWLPEYQGLITDIAAWLNQNKAAKLTVEGHCDERGTIDYNLALGEKRAESVKSQLVKAGVKDDRIKTISYGKEAPADPGHTEAAWAKNRRAHFKIDERRAEMKKCLPLCLLSLMLLGCASSQDVGDVRRDVTTVYQEFRTYRDSTDARLSKLEKRYVRAFPEHAVSRRPLAQAVSRPVHVPGKQGRKDKDYPR